jgi:hypothetical protein
MEWERPINRCVSPYSTDRQASADAWCEPVDPRLIHSRAHAQSFGPSQCDITLEMMIFVTELMPDHYEALGVVRER